MQVPTIETTRHRARVQTGRPVRDRRRRPHPPGAARERRACFSDYHRSRSSDLRDRLVRRHLPLARHLAARFEWRGVPSDDLYQIASVGLIHAVDRFDPDRGISFSSFAVPTIVGEIRRHFRDRAWDVHVPRRLQEIHLSARIVNDELTMVLRREPTTIEIAHRLGVSAATVIEALEAGASFNAEQLPAPASEGVTRRHVRSPRGYVQEEARFSLLEDRADLMRALAGLPDNEATIVRWYFGEGLSQITIATRLGVSQMQVSRLLRKSVDRLRESLLGAG